MTRRSQDNDRAFRAALRPAPCPDYERWQTVPHVVSLTDGYWEIATDGHRMHVRACAPPSPVAVPDDHALTIRTILEAIKRPTRELTLSLADLRTMRRIHGALGKRWRAVIDLATGDVRGFHAGPAYRDAAARDLARRESVLGGPVLTGACAPHPGAPACYARYLLDAVAHAETLTVYFAPENRYAPLRLVSADGARWAVVMPCSV
jgi:hypothetical protein